jgi:hypothetical protein
MRVASLLIAFVVLVSPLHTSALAPQELPQGAGQAAADDEKAKKPTLSVRASPAVSFSPARVRAVAELKGGPDDYQALYCAAVEWDWGDLTQSEEAADCEPYQEGVSQITRRFSAEHVYRTAGRFRVQIRLKRNNKVLVGANTTVQVRPGVRDLGY